MGKRQRRWLLGNSAQTELTKARAKRFDLGFILAELHMAHCELPARLVSNSNLPYREVLKVDGNGVEDASEEETAT